MIIALVVLSIVLPTATFAQQMAPATPIAPETPQAPPATIGPSQPIAPAPAPAPVVIIPSWTNKDFWVGTSFDLGLPYTGFVVTANQNLSNTPILGCSVSPFTFDGILNLDLGYTPIKLDTFHLGGMIRLSGALSFTYIGSRSGWDGYYYGNDTVSEYALTSWFAISPMIAGRIQLAGNSTLVLAFGASYYSYGDYEVIFSDTAGDPAFNQSASAPTTGAIGASGWKPAALLQLVEGSFTTELGLTGPDFYVGCGYAF